MSTQSDSGVISTRGEARQVSPEIRKVLRNTYMLLGMTMLPVIAGAALGVAFPIIAYVGLWGFFCVFLAGMFGFQMLVMKNRNSIAGVCSLFAFTAFMGYMLGPILSVVLSSSNGVDLIAIAFGGTAATFFVLAGYASVTTKNFATPSMLKTLTIGIFMAFAFLLVALIFQFSILSLAVSAIFIPISSMFIVYTINNIIRGGEKNYIMATMTLFIMLFNIFQSLLHILMVFAGGRD